MFINSLTFVFVLADDRNLILGFSFFFNLVIRDVYLSNLTPADNQRSFIYLKLRIHWLIGVNTGVSTGCNTDRV